METMNTLEAAEFLQVAPAYIRQLLADNKLRGRKFPPSLYRGEWVIEKQSVIEYAANRKKKGRPKR